MKIVIIVTTNYYNSTNQISVHLDAQKFSCSCRKAHEILIASELVDKLEDLYTTLNCSKIIVTSGYCCLEHVKAVDGQHCCRCLLL